jgi:hypothetical protein
MVTQIKRQEGQQMELTNIRGDHTREDLGLLLEHIQEDADQFGGEGMARLARALLRMSTVRVLNIDNLAQADIDELWTLANDIARDNGVVFEPEDR